MQTETNRGTVLVVDDDPTIIDFVCMALSDDGFDCVGAQNGEEATRRVAEFNPSLIVLDVSMPRMNGAEFCQWLRSNGHSNIPLIVMTAGQNAAKTCAELGAQAFLAKPFELSALRSSVLHWSRGA